MFSAKILILSSEQHSAKISCETSLFLIGRVLSNCHSLLQGVLKVNAKRLYFKSHTMAITGANAHIGSAGLTNRNRRSCGNILKFFLRRGEKNIWGPTVGRNASVNKQVLQLLFAETCSLV